MDILKAIILMIKLHADETAPHIFGHEDILRLLSSIT